MKEKVKNDVTHFNKFINVMKKRKYQRIIISIFTLILVFIIVKNGAYPKKYNIKLGNTSDYDITAPRDVENTKLTIKNAKIAKDSVKDIVTNIESNQISKEIEKFFTNLRNCRNEIELKKNDESFSQVIILVNDKFKKLCIAQNLNITKEQIEYLLSTNNLPSQKIDRVDIEVNALIKSAQLEDITDDNLGIKISNLQNKLDAIKEIDSNLKAVGNTLIRTFLKPNKKIDIDATNFMKEKIYQEYIKNKKEMVWEGQRIINKGDIVSDETISILKDLNLLENGDFDYKFDSGIMMIMFVLSLMLYLFVKRFSKRVLYNKGSFFILCVIIVVILLVSLILIAFDIKAYFIPVFIAPMLISLILDIKSAIIVNLVLSCLITLMAKNNVPFFFISLLGGTVSAILVEKADQRGKLAVVGLIVASCNALVFIGINLITANTTELLTNSAIVFLISVLSIIITIGTLPFWESIFNILTPFKLLELSNPNHPLVKRLLMEAPGTYHHSLLVGNLAEMGAVAIGANSLLARVGAYYHDVGKLKRPHFFKENQLIENPHDNMESNLSTIVIVSHTKDGIELAKKYKLPQQVKDIIVQHHGTTIAQYFYYKAINQEKKLDVKEDDFRYLGPKPSSKEAVLVMLADCVEAAVRSMKDRDKEKISNLINKIIKDKLNDGQLDLCDITLKDLNLISESFLSVLTGYFHQRIEYPELKAKDKIISNQIVKEG